MLTKLCNHCRKTLPITELVRDSRRPDGYSNICKPCLRAANTARIEEDRDRHNTTRREKKRADPRIALVQGAKHRAKLNNLAFNITIEDIVVPAECPALGIPLVMNKVKVGFDSPTLDKLLPELGYVKGNVVVVSHLANRIKSNATPEQLRRVANYYSKLLTN